MKETWNNRYSENEFVYGTEANAFLKEELQKLPKGKILFLGEGEGRNAIFAATLGWEVDAIDYSEAGKKKAELLASKSNVTINYIVADIIESPLPKESYDAVALIYIHVNEETKPILHQKVIDALKPKGKIIIEAFDKEQLKYNSGGPKDKDLLYDLQSITEDFIDFEFEKLSRDNIELSEGKLHQGKAAVVRFVGIK
ncbi:MAG: methyltransferase domain-containing protein [Melioribacteraceae bacterium]|nr:methyltransferase domain-containing protein [Melioribacteraceae bacterium]